MRKRPLGQQDRLPSGAAFVDLLGPCCRSRLSPPTVQMCHSRDPPGFLLSSTRQDGLQRPVEWEHRRRDQPQNLWGSSPSGHGASRRHADLDELSVCVVPAPGSPRQGGAQIGRSRCWKFVARPALTNSIRSRARQGRTRSVRARQTQSTGPACGVAICARLPSVKSSGRPMACGVAKGR